MIKPKLPHAPIRLAVLTGGLLALAACAPLPLAPAEPPVASLPAPPGLRSLGQWQDAATDHARDLVDTLRRIGQAGRTVALRAEQQPATEFDRAYHELLITRLVAEGLRVVQGAPADLDLSYRMQLVVFPGAPAGASHELLLNTSVRQGPALLARRSEAYSLRDPDATLFRSAAVLPPPPPARTLPVLGR